MKKWIIMMADFVGDFFFFLIEDKDFSIIAT